jgi:hypothetical protein
MLCHGGGGRGFEENFEAIPTVEEVLESLPTPYPMGETVHTTMHSIPY